MSSASHRNAPAGRGRRVVFRLIALLIVVMFAALALTVTELALRSSRASSLYQEVRRYPPHPFLQAVPAMAADHVNRHGFRGDEVELDKGAKTFRIFTIGGSTTLGVGNEYRDTYPYMLQAALSARYPDMRIEVQNAGCAWYTSAHALVSYTTAVRRFQPDLVIFFEAMNDLVRSFSPPWLATGPFQPDYSHYLGPYARMAGPQSRFFDTSGSFLTWQLVRQWWRGDPDPFSHRAPNVQRMRERLVETDRPSFRSLSSYRWFYESVIHEVEADRIPILVASQPSIFRPDLSAEDRQMLWFAPLLCAENGTCPSLGAMIHGMEIYNAASREIAARRQVPYLEFEAAVPKTREFFSDDVHLRGRGNERIAAIAADAIVRGGWIDRRAGRGSAAGVSRSKLP